MGTSGPGPSGVACSCSWDKQLGLLGLLVLLGSSWNAGAGEHSSNRSVRAYRAFGHSKCSGITYKSIEILRPEQMKARLVYEYCED